MHVGATFDATTQRILLSGLPINESHLIFTEAGKKETAALPIISRAALLLRVSTGSVSVLLQDAAIAKQELSFVWDNYGFNNGFWDSAKPVIEYNSLWSEIESEYTDLFTNITSIPNSSRAFKEIDENLGNLSQFNRAALWGI